MLLATLSSLLLYVASAEESTDVALRSKRQSYYYTCGSYLDQYYSIYPCDYYQQPSQPKEQCQNGGTPVGVGCYSDSHCASYGFWIQVTCSNGRCCTLPNGQVTVPPSNSLGFCPNGQRSSVRCSRNGDCSAGQTCMSGLCCTTNGNEYLTACAGLGALASCTNSACGSFFCSTSNYCCECAVGRTSGTCANGCPSGYSCSSSGYCCPSCPNGQSPYGACFNGQCASGYTCRAGNICCQ